MKSLAPRHETTLLRLLRDSEEPVGSAVIAAALASQGLVLSPRSIRLYLHELEQRGLVSAARRGRSGGRRITEAGQAALREATACDRLDYAAARGDALAWQVDLDPARGQGRVAMNVSLVERRSMIRALDEMRPVFKAGLAASDRLYLAHGGQSLGTLTVPEGMSALATVCSITVAGVLLGRRIPQTPRFGAVVELEAGRPRRLTDVIHYEGCTLDPHLVFLRCGRTSVREAALRGQGRVLASFREIPASARETVLELGEELRRAGVPALLELGEPGGELLGMGVPAGRCGMLLLGGLNPLAALEESGIPAEHHTLCTLLPYEQCVPYGEARGLIAGPGGDAA